MSLTQTKLIDRINIFFRCLVIQASWNFKALIGMGFCFCVIPLARRLHDSPEERSKFLRRHLEYFNAHPYFASYCLGAVVKLEEEAIMNQTDTRQISIFKERMAGPLGVLGDELFWNRTKPVAVALAMCLAFAFGWIALPIFLIVYNIPHFYIRFKGWHSGYKLGFGIVNELSMRRFQSSLDKISLAGLFLAAALFPLAALWSYTQSLPVLISFCVSVLIVFVLIYIKLSIKFVIVTAIGIGIIIGFFFSY